MSITAPVATRTTPTAAQINATATAATGGSGSYTYQWYRAVSPDFTPGTSNIVAGQTSLTLADTTAIADVLYWYLVRATEVGGSGSTADSNVIAAKISSPPGNPILGFIGDSWFTTGGADDLSGAPTAPTVCCNRLGQLYGYRSVTGISRGLAGTETSTWISTYLAPAITAFHAAGVTHVVAMLGFNDAHHPSPLDPPPSKATYKANMVTICNTLTAAGFVVVLFGPQMAIDADSLPLYNAAILTYQAACAELADNSTVFYAGSQIAEWFIMQPAVGGEWNAGLYHPNVAGVQSLGFFLAKGFQEAIFPSLDGSCALTVADRTAIASQMRTELAPELARIDATISSRLATTGYTAPPTDYQQRNIAVTLPAGVATEATALAVVAQTTPAAIRGAVGLDDANLDTQLGEIPTTKTGYSLAGNGLDAISTSAPSTAIASWTFRDWMYWMFCRFSGKAVKTSTSIDVYSKDDTAISTQAISSSGTTETQGEVNDPSQ